MEHLRAFSPHLYVARRRYSQGRRMTNPDHGLQEVRECEGSLSIFAMCARNITRRVREADWIGALWEMR
jgi:hypothetical protein